MFNMDHNTFSHKGATIDTSLRKYNRKTSTTKSDGKVSSRKYDRKIILEAAPEDPNNLSNHDESVKNQGKERSTPPFHRYLPHH